MEGQKWWKMTLLKVWSPGRSLAGRSLSGRSILWAEVVSGPKYISGPKYSPGWSCFGPKYFRAKVFRAEVFPGRSECRAKAVSGPNWVWAKKSTEKIDLSWLLSKSQLKANREESFPKTFKVKHCYLVIDCLSKAFGGDMIFDFWWLNSKSFYKMQAIF